MLPVSPDLAFAPFLIVVSAALCGMAISVPAIQKPWALRTPARARFTLAILFAVLGAVALSADGGILYPNPCIGLEPWSYTWIMNMCWLQS